MHGTILYDHEYSKTIRQCKIFQLTFIQTARFVIPTVLYVVQHTDLRGRGTGLLGTKMIRTEPNNSISYTDHFVIPYRLVVFVYTGKGKEL